MAEVQLAQILQGICHMAISHLKGAFPVGRAILSNTVDCQAETASWNSQFQNASFWEGLADNMMMVAVPLSLILPGISQMASLPLEDASPVGRAILASLPEVSQEETARSWAFLLSVTHQRLNKASMGNIQAVALLARLLPSVLYRNQ